MGERLHRALVTDHSAGTPHHDETKIFRYVLLVEECHPHQILEAFVRKDATHKKEVHSTPAQHLAQDRVGLGPVTLEVQQDGQHASSFEPHLLQLEAVILRITQRQVGDGGQSLELFSSLYRNTNQLVIQTQEVRSVRDVLIDDHLTSREGAQRLGERRRQGEMQYR